MANLHDPYQAPYQEIIAIASQDGKQIELIECFDCIGGGMWVAKHYAQSPLVTSVRKVGTTIRYHLTPGSVELQLAGSKFPAGISGAEVSETEIAVSYLGMGGGGVGASICRAGAKGVLRALTHNIAREVEDDNSRYLSHTITQLFPVAQRTKNCVAVAIEFATTEPDMLIDKVQKLVEKYTLSTKTGMVAFRGFDPSPLEEYAWMVKRGEITLEKMESIKHLLDIRISASADRESSAQLRQSPSTPDLTRHWSYVGIPESTTA